MSKVKQTNIYIDGSCINNPGPGGYGIIVEYDGQKKEISGGFSKTTNNRMEVMAAIVALESLKEKCNVTLYSDSKYLVDAIIKGWAKNWKAKGWMRNKKDRALNPDLWDRLLSLCDKQEVIFKWVRGHDGHTENERCDQLAQQMARQRNLPIDKGFRN